MVLWLLGGAVMIFLLVVLRGAPYVPTHRAQVEQALDMLDIAAGGTIVDLGSGDGVFLKAAAQRGYQAVGYEINPILCIVSYVRCWPYRRQVHIKWRDFWLTSMPKDVDAVFVFLAGPYLRRLDYKLTKERSRKNNKPLTVISYGFTIPGKATPLQSKHALHLYHY